MIKIAICDDEKNIRMYLSALVRKQGIECEIKEYATAEDYLSAGTEYDLIFLDIEMGDSVSGMNGMQLAGWIRDRESVRQPVIIFVTGYESYVYDAFDVGAFQYLLKPLDEEKFADIFDRAVKQILSGKSRKKLMIQYAGTRKTIPLDHIHYMESQNHKIVIHLQDGTVEYYAKMKDLEKELQGQFFRIHKGYLINLACVDEYNKTEVALTSGDRLMISKYKYEAFTRAYLHFMQQEE